MSSHIGACVGFPLYRRSHFGEFRRPDVAPEESSLARILLEVHGFEHTIPGVHVEKKKKLEKFRKFRIVTAARQTQMCDVVPLPNSLQHT